MMKKENIAQKVKSLVAVFLLSEQRPAIKLSVYLAEQLDHNYTYLSFIFSEVYDTTIEKYFIESKVAKARHLLSDTNEPIYIIAEKLHYCNKSHFSTQFKAIEGTSPSIYRKDNQPE